MVVLPTTEIIEPIFSTVFFFQDLQVIALKPYKNKEIPLSTQNIHVNHLSIVDKYFYFFVK